MKITVIKQGETNEYIVYIEDNEAYRHTFTDTDIENILCDIALQYAIENKRVPKWLYWEDKIMKDNDKLSSNTIRQICDTLVAAGVILLLSVLSAICLLHLTGRI